MSSLLTMIGAAGGSTGAYYFLGCASGASANDRIQDVFKMSPTEYKGASNWYDSDGNMYFGYFALQTTVGYEGFGIAMLAKKIREDGKSGFSKYKEFFIYNPNNY